MLRIIKYHKVFVTLLFLLSFFTYSCRNATQIQKSVQTKNETQETKPLIIPQYELVETPYYKRLKQKVERIQNEVNELEDKRSNLLVKYTEEYSLVKKISKDLEDAKKRLALFELELNSEREKLEKQPINPPV